MRLGWTRLRLFLHRTRPWLFVANLLFLSGTRSREEAPADGLPEQVEMALIHDKLMAKTDDGWNRGKFAEVARGGVLPCRREKKQSIAGESLKECTWCRVQHRI